MDILTLITLATYILAGVGAIGLIVLITGIYKKKKEMIQYGALTIVAAVTILVCGYFIFRKTIEKADDYMYEYIDEYNRQR